MNIESFVDEEVGGHEGMGGVLVFFAWKIECVACFDESLGLPTINRVITEDAPVVAGIQAVV